jgi:3'(2'), 5'-bisphosphate nucleotidase
LLLLLGNPDIFPAEVDAALRQVEEEVVAARAKGTTLTFPFPPDFPCQASDETLDAVCTALAVYYPNLVTAADRTNMDFLAGVLWRVSQLSGAACPLDLERTTAIRAVAAAAAVCQSVHGSLCTGKLIKGDKSPVTVADFASQAMINHIVGEVFPDDAIVGEEDSSALREDTDEARTLLQRVVTLTNEGLASLPAGVLTQPSLTAEQICAAIDRGADEGGPAGRRWCLDPIDGTKGFLRGEQYAVCLALLEDGEPILGVLGCPNLPHDLAAPDTSERGLILVATKGKTPEQLPILPPDLASDSPAGTPISVTSTTDPAEASFTESVEAGHSNHGDAHDIAKLLGVTKPGVRMDSQAKYANLARGSADIYLRLPTRKGYQEKIWDHGAGILIVQAAGGAVTDVFGKPLDFGLGRTLANNTGVIATNGVLHKRVVEAVQAVLFPTTSYTVTISAKDRPTPAQVHEALVKELGIAKEQVVVE